jgi:hypothetical protein
MASNFVENDTNGWIEIDVSALKPTKDDTEIPFRVIANRFKSSSEDCEAFIHEPLQALLAARDAGVEACRDVREDSRVTTFIVNHHVGLRLIHLYAMAKISTGTGAGAAMANFTSPPTIAITIWKLGDGA